MAERVAQVRTYVEFTEEELKVAQARIYVEITEELLRIAQVGAYIEYEEDDIIFDTVILPQGVGALVQNVPVITLTRR